MRALGNCIVRGQLEAIGVISFLSILSLIIPFPLSGIPIALVTMRRGGLIGMQVIVGSLLATSVLIILLGLPPYSALVFVLLIWLPVWCGSMAIRLSQSQGMLVMTASAISVLWIALMYILIGDVSAYWKSMLEMLFSYFSEVSGKGFEEAVGAIDQAASRINAVIALGFVVCLVLTVLAGRWWQSMLFFPGEFRKEFYTLRLPRGLIYLIIVGVATLLLTEAGIQQAIVRDILAVLVISYLFQGVSTVHRVVNLKKMSRAWLIVMYWLLLMLQPMVLFVAIIGMADSWVGSKNIDSDKNIS